MTGLLVRKKITWEVKLEWALEGRPRSLWVYYKEIDYSMGEEQRCKDLDAKGDMVR